MNFKTLISIEDLSGRLEAPGVVVADCRFSLADPRLGYSQYLEAHIPGAVYADLDRDLSGPIVPGNTGRHPLPSAKKLAATFGRLGIGPDSQVVAYDDASGAIAARLWWLLRFAGHDAVAVLDGGWTAWVAAELPTRAGDESNPPTDFQAEIRSDWLATAADVETDRQRDDRRVVDSRGANRYRGEDETIDPVAGHIPGAVSLPYEGNLTEGTARFLPDEALRARLSQVVDAEQPEATTFYCGSGVTAAHNVLAAAHAGLGMPRLYVGSWSEWITDDRRPVATGPQPGGGVDESAGRADPGR